jgi:two-component system OmpR family response regulator
MTATKILVVDDEPNIRDLLTASLKFAGYEVAAAANGNDAINRALDWTPDLILLDVMLPDISGFGVTKKLRSAGSEVPVLFLTARDETQDKITGLTVGGDDYVTKPFSLDELHARISAILRRTQRDETASSVIEAGELVINEDAHEVLVRGVSVDLSPTEYQLLRFLAVNPNRVLTKAQILDHVWEYDFNGEMGIVESYVSYLRRKLDPLSSEPLIVTKRGVGYLLRVPKPTE